MDFEDREDREDTKNTQIAKLHDIRSKKHPEENMFLY